MPTSRREIDTELYNAVPHGAYKALAEHRGIARQNVSKYYDPKDGTYQSVFSKALVELGVIARVCPEWARRIVAVFVYFLVMWCGTPELSGNALEDIGAIAMKLLNPNTPEVERMPLALKMRKLANEVVEGLQFDDREDAPGAGA